MASENRLISASFAQHIANVELPADQAGIVQWVLSHTPTVDAVEVVHGQWVFEPIEFTYEKDIKCSVCGEYADHATNYCPNCGAKMDGGNK